MDPTPEKRLQIYLDAINAIVRDRKMDAPEAMEFCAEFMRSYCADILREIAQRSERRLN